MIMRITNKKYAVLIRIFCLFMYFLSKGDYMIYILKNTFLIITTIYIFFKSLNLTLNKKNMLYTVIFCILTSFLSFFLYNFIGGADIYIIITLIYLFLLKTGQQHIDITLFICLFSYATSFIVSLLAVIIIFIPSYCIITITGRNIYFDILSSASIGIISLILCKVIFNLKGLKNGLSF